jgi:hypothetical protein
LGAAPPAVVILNAVRDPGFCFDFAFAFLAVILREAEDLLLLNVAPTRLVVDHFRKLLHIHRLNSQRNRRHRRLIARCSMYDERPCSPIAGCLLQGLKWLGQFKILNKKTAPNHNQVDRFIGYFSASNKMSYLNCNFKLLKIKKRSIR